MAKKVSLARMDDQVNQVMLVLPDDRVCAVNQEKKVNQEMKYKEILAHRVKMAMADIRVFLVNPVCPVAQDVLCVTVHNVQQVLLVHPVPVVSQVILVKTAIPAVRVLLVNQVFLVKMLHRVTAPTPTVILVKMVILV